MRKRRLQREQGELTSLHVIQVTSLFGTLLPVVLRRSQRMRKSQQDKLGLGEVGALPPR